MNMGITMEKGVPVGNTTMSMGITMEKGVSVGNTIMNMRITMGKSVLAWSTIMNMRIITRRRAQAQKYKVADADSSYDRDRVFT